MTYLNLQKDIQGFKTPAADFSDLIYTATLLDASHSEITVPGNYQNWWVRIQPDYYGTVWVSVNNTAAVPAGSTFAAATSELMSIAVPYELKVNSGDVISVYNNTGLGQALNISIALYGVKNGS